MKGLTVRQPWAQLIMDGRKRYETRSFRTHYRGPVAIHSSARLDRVQHARAEVEIAAGDYRPGRFAWRLGDVRALSEPVPHRGSLGLWSVPAGLAERLA